MNRPGTAGCTGDHGRTLEEEFGAIRPERDRFSTADIVFDRCLGALPTATPEHPDRDDRQARVL